MKWVWVQGARYLRDADMNEKHTFIRVGNKQLYTVEYRPDAARSNMQGVILCKPIWGERIRTQRILVNLARQLCIRGYTVLSCDYYGDGNSGGDTIDLNFPSMVEDVEILHRHLRATSDVESCSLVGLLLGSNVAMKAEEQIAGIRKLVLFEPVLNPGEFFKGALLINLATQMATYKKIIKTREQLIEDLHRGETVNIDGFVIGKEFWTSFEHLSPFRPDPGSVGSAVFYALAANNKKPADYSPLAETYRHGETKSIPREFDWTGWKKHVPKPELFFNAVEAELLA